jgi:hypothetical protein
VVYENCRDSGIMQLYRRISAKTVMWGYVLKIDGMPTDLLWLNKNMKRTVEGTNKRTSEIDGRINLLEVL